MVRNLNLEQSSVMVLWMNYLKSVSYVQDLIVTETYLTSSISFYFLDISQKYKLFIYFYIKD